VTKPEEGSLLPEKCTELVERRFTVLSTDELLKGVVSLTDADDEDWSLYCNKPENATLT